MAVNSVNNYRIVITGPEWEWDVQYKDINDVWSSYRSGKAWTLKRAIKKARGRIPVQIIQSQ